MKAIIVIISFFSIYNICNGQSVFDPRVINSNFSKDFQRFFDYQKFMGKNADQPSTFMYVSFSTDCNMKLENFGIKGNYNKKTEDEIQKTLKILLDSNAINKFKCTNNTSYLFPILFRVGGYDCNYNTIKAKSPNFPYSDPNCGYTNFNYIIENMLIAFNTLSKDDILYKGNYTMLPPVELSEIFDNQINNIFFKNPY